MSYTYLFLVCLVVTGAVAMDVEIDSAKSSFKCIMCSDTFTGSSDCVTNPKADSPDIGEITCSTSCYVSVVKVFGKIANIERGCTEECKSSAGCPYIGKCLTCCSGSNYCNDNADF
ncbi:uncharacterized protein [Ptychodera flava]|uniref:uncharacterized protein n=1 Tax=Ptychodera flava TaxID=63121 RepID=UPI003969C039